MIPVGDIVARTETHVATAAVLALGAALIKGYFDVRDLGRRQDAYDKDRAENIATKGALALLDQRVTQAERERADLRTQVAELSDMNVLVDELRTGVKEMRDLVGSFVRDTNDAFQKQGNQLAYISGKLGADGHDTHYDSRK